MKDIFLLDLDDTLLDFPRAEEQNFYESLKSVGAEPSRELYGRFHLINDDLWRRLERGEIEREKLKVRRFELLFKECGIEADAEKVAAFYVKNFDNICYPFEGSAALLQELSAAGRVFIVSNGGASTQHSHVKLAGFGQYLSGMFISEEIGFHKPMSEFAHHVEAHIENYDRARAVWIGDSLTSDMVCAKSVGIDFILYLPRTMSVSYDGLKAGDYKTLFDLIQGM